MGPITPVQFTSTSIRPQRSAMLLATRSTLSQSQTSSAKVRTSRLFALVATKPPGVPERDVNARCARSSPKRRVIALPIVPDAPAIKQTLLMSLEGMETLSFGCDLEVDPSRQLPEPTPPRDFESSPQ
jgi:hypothetical protein